MKEQAFAKSRVFPAALLIGLLGAIASSAWVTLSFASRSEADPGPTFPEPTPVIGGSIGIEDAAKSLASERPDVAALVDSISHRDSAALLSALNWDTVSCLPPNVRGGPSSAYCEKLGVTEGTRIEVFPVEIGFQLLRERSDLSQFLQRFLLASPRLELVARSPDGSLIVSFATDEFKSDVTNSTLWGVLFTFTGDRSHAQSLETIVTSTTALDKIRDREMFVGEGERREWDVLAVSPELAARDEAKHAERYDSPDAQATPSANR